MEKSARYGSFCLFFQKRAFLDIVLIFRKFRAFWKSIFHGKSGYLSGVSHLTPFSSISSIIYYVKFWEYGENPDYPMPGDPQYMGRGGNIL